jgi:hypothetical protein
MWAITRNNCNKNGIGNGATAFLVTVNDTDMGGTQKVAIDKGFEVVKTDGNSDAGVLFLRPKSGRSQDYGALLNLNKVTVTAVSEPSGKRLVPVSGGFETKPTGGMGFGTTDNVGTTGEFFKTDGENPQIIKNKEDDCYVWHNGSDIKNFRGGWMSFKWQ